MARVKNNRPANNARRIQKIDMGNGKYRFIRHEGSETKLHPQPKKQKHNL